MTFYLSVLCVLRIACYLMLMLQRLVLDLRKCLQEQRNLNRATANLVPPSTVPTEGHRLQAVKLC